MECQLLTRIPSRISHTRFTGTAGRVHFVVYLTHFPRYGPSCCSLKFMHFQTSVIRLVDRVTWSYRFVIILQITLIKKICKLWKIILINIDKLCRAANLWKHKLVLSTSKISIFPSKFIFFFNRPSFQIILFWDLIYVLTQRKCIVKAGLHTNFFFVVAQSSH